MWGRMRILKEKLEQLLNSVIDQLESTDSIAKFEELRVKYLGKKSELSNILKNMKSLSNEEKISTGKIINDIKKKMEVKFSETLEKINNFKMEKKLKEEVIDITLPGKKISLGHKNPIQIVLDEIQEIFLNMGFVIEEGPDIDTEYYNFEALNIFKDHPARSEQDTFYIDDNHVLRTHTSTIQIRTMENKKPPIRVIAPGRVYRSDELDATHSPIFYQMEGLVVDKNISMAHLKSTLNKFIKLMFGSEIKTKFRAHHFPFTEPSAEMDVSCFACKGIGCSICKNSGYIEILGCGMVHPDVLRKCDIDPEEYSGFAFGFGIDRMVMLKYGIEDIRFLYESNLRFLSQF